MISVEDWEKLKDIIQGGICADHYNMEYEIMLDTDDYTWIKELLEKDE
jgi:hypothetical protein